MFWDLGASGVGSKVWVLTIGVLEVNPEVESIRAQRGRARSALFSRVSLKIQKNGIQNFDQLNGIEFIFFI